MKRLAIALFVSLSAVVSTARDTAIYNGKLTSQLNANGMSVTNLPPPVASGDAVNKGYVDSIAGVTPSFVTNTANDRIDAKVAPWAMKGQPQPTGSVTNVFTNGVSAVVGGVARITIPNASGVNTNAVCGIITNHVTSGYLCTVAAASAMTNALPAWTKAATKPTYTAAEVGARPVEWMPSAEDVGALPVDEYGQVYQSVSFQGTVLEHNGGSDGRVFLSRLNEDSFLFKRDEYKWHYAFEGDESEDTEIATLGDLPTASSLRAVTYADGAPDDHKTAAGILSVAGIDSASMLTNMIDHTNARFSNEVMRVGIGLDAQKVAQINAILNEMGESPIGTATTVGGLLAALAAAVAWLKQKTASIETAVGTANNDLADALGGNY